MCLAVFRRMLTMPNGIVESLCLIPTATAYHTYSQHVLYTIHICRIFEYRRIPRSSTTRLSPFMALASAGSRVISVFSFILTQKSSIVVHGCSCLLLPMSAMLASNHIHAFSLGSRCKWKNIYDTSMFCRKL